MREKAQPGILLLYDKKKAIVRVDYTGRRMNGSAQNRTYESGNSNTAAFPSDNQHLMQSVDNLTGHPHDTIEPSSR